MPARKRGPSERRVRDGTRSPVPARRSMRRPVSRSAKRPASRLIYFLARALPRNAKAPSSPDSHQIHDAVLVQIHGEHLRACARLVVHELGHELGPAGRLLVANRAVDVQHRWAVWIGIGVALVVREEPFADDEVGECRRRSCRRRPSHGARRRRRRRHSSWRSCPRSCGARTRSSRRHRASARTTRARTRAPAAT